MTEGVQRGRNRFEQSSNVTSQIARRKEKSGIVSSKDLNSSISFRKGFLGKLKNRDKLFLYRSYM